MAKRLDIVSPWLWAYPLRNLRKNPRAAARSLGVLLFATAGAAIRNAWALAIGGVLLKVAGLPAPSIKQLISLAILIAPLRVAEWTAVHSLARGTAMLEAEKAAGKAFRTHTIAQRLFFSQQTQQQFSEPEAACRSRRFNRKGESQ